MSDALVAAQAKIRLTAELCAPADINGLNPSAVDNPDHLLAYAVAPLDSAALATLLPLRGQEVSNEFGTAQLDLTRSDRLLVPTAVQFNGLPSAPQSPAVDHFSCYKVKRSKGAPHSAPIRNVTVDDPFDSTTVTIRRPTRLCTPANINHQSPAAATHPGQLLCYHVDHAPTTPGRLFINNEFGAAVLNPRVRRELCVPSTWVASVQRFDLSGRWLGFGATATVVQHGSTLTIDNWDGGGHSIEAQLVRTDRIRMATFIGRISPDGNRIDWSNNTTWVRIVPPPIDLSGPWSGFGTTATIQQHGNSLTIDNWDGTGRSIEAQIIGNDQIRMATLTGRVSADGQRIDWSDGTNWVRVMVAPPADLSGRWQGFGAIATVRQSGNTLTIENWDGGGHVIEATLVDADHIQMDVFVGTIRADRNRIDWSNGTTWTRI